MKNLLISEYSNHKEWLFIQKGCGNILGIIFFLLEAETFQAQRPPPRGIRRTCYVIRLRFIEFGGLRFMKLVVSCVHKML